MPLKPTADAFQPADLPASGRVIQPILWQTIERWHDSSSEIGSWEDVCRLLPARQSGWSALVERIQAINAFQWWEEDRSRDPEASDPTLAAVKRSIDASNRRRVQAVEAFDEHIHLRLQESGLLSQDAPLHSESPGSIVDRLSILALKIFHLKQTLAQERRQPTAPTSATKPPAEMEAATPPGSVAARYERTDGGAAEDTRLAALYQRLRGLLEQMVDLTECLDRYLAGLMSGRVGMKLYRQVKVYRDFKSGQLHSDHV
jgi:hypothetical protein